jgi:hypothetical protein
MYRHSQNSFQDVRTHQIEYNNCMLRSPHPGQEVLCGLLQLPDLLRRVLLQLVCQVLWWLRVLRQ